MPLIQHSNYRAPVWLRGGHAQTIHPVLFRKVEKITAHPHRLELDDGDFLDVEWTGKDRERLAIISHGLEGSLGAIYVQGMATALWRRGWDVLVWSFRGCSGELNRNSSFYHSGATRDLDAVIQHAFKCHPANKIDLVGFSLGGNLTLKYIGERGGDIDPRIVASACFSVPCELASSSAELARWENKIYMERFLKSLRSKVREKAMVYPDVLDTRGIDGLKSFAEFDERFTAPLHGFSNAEDYWMRSSCRQFLPGVTIPTLLVSAANDPILGKDCYPYPEAENSDSFYLEVPRQGGHVGFGPGSEYWSETRAAEFLALR
ncbi:YheT family hydrolase [Luteolibacter algae]|uniref:YheT family hydrolase n=1 Tax=Luteolibacter algae TaxID=454151 RepID=A0ABW5D255_9BACT